MTDSLAERLRDLQIDNFAIRGDDMVRIGAILFRVRRCACGGRDCDGLQFEAIGPGAAAPRLAIH